MEEKMVAVRDAEWEAARLEELTIFIVGSAEKIPRVLWTVVLRNDSAP